MSQGKFVNSWLQIPEYKDWLVKTNDGKVYCTFCDQTLRTKKTALPEHAKTEKHQNNVRIGKKYSYHGNSSLNVVTSGQTNNNINIDGIGHFANVVAEKLRNLPADRVTTAQTGILKILMLSETVAKWAIINGQIIENFLRN